MLLHKVNVYNSVEITDECTRGTVRGAPLETAEFEKNLWDSLRIWKQEGRKGIWLKLDSSKSELIPIAIRAGFQFHSCSPTHVMMTAWVATDMANKLPPGPAHFIGVAGFILNSKNQVLCVREKTGPSAGIKDFWKLPGGLVDQHENIQDAVVREIREETGMDSKFRQIATIQEVHHSERFGGSARAGTTDLYMVCVLDAINEEKPLIPQAEEIEECKWIPLEELLKMRFYSRKGTVFQKMFQTAASVALRESSGMNVDELKLGFVPGTNSLYFAESKL